MSFATLKRGINGVCHHVGKQRLHRYLSEFDFRYNAREVSDVERRDLSIKQVVGKRLKYRDSCGGTVLKNKPGLTGIGLGLNIVLFGWLVSFIWIVPRERWGYDCSG